MFTITKKNKECTIAPYSPSEGLVPAVSVVRFISISKEKMGPAGFEPATSAV